MIRLDRRMMKGGSNLRRVFSETDGPIDKNSLLTIPTGMMLLKTTQSEFLFYLFYTIDLFHIHYQDLFHFSLIVISKCFS